jgi:AcrR family transcriptional regulator
MGRKAGITIDDIVGAAAAIADRDGLAAATLSAVAAELGIKTPSLYNHIAGLFGLRRQLALHAAGELAVVIADAAAGHDPRQAIRFAAVAYRKWATGHVGQYEALLPAATPDGDPELYEAMAVPVRHLLTPFEQLGFSEEQAIHLIRGLRAMLHGFADLERQGGFGMPIDLDESFNVALDLMLDRIAAGTGE